MTPNGHALMLSEQAQRSNVLRVCVAKERHMASPLSGCDVLPWLVVHAISFDRLLFLRVVVCRLRALLQVPGRVTRVDAASNETKTIRHIRAGLNTAGAVHNFYSGQNVHTNHGSIFHLSFFNRLRLIRTQSSLHDLNLTELRYMSALPNNVTMAVVNQRLMLAVQNIQIDAQCFATHSTDQSWTTAIKRHEQMQSSNSMNRCSHQTACTDVNIKQHARMQTRDSFCCSAN